MVHATYKLLYIQNTLILRAPLSWERGASHADSRAAEWSPDHLSTLPLSLLVRENLETSKRKGFANTLEERWNLWDK